jgi:hypothetical protein
MSQSKLMKEQPVFHNTGHAAQSRYVAALTNPWAAPPVPIPDSFLEANVAKVAKEIIVQNAENLYLTFEKSTDSPTGNYKLEVFATDSTGAEIHRSTYNSYVGTRLVAAGICFEDSRNITDISGLVTYVHNSAASKSGNYELVYSDAKTERNNGTGSMRYAPKRRQALDFEGAVSEQLRLNFSEAFRGVVRIAVIVEFDGTMGFTESLTSNTDFVLTNVMQNYHAGQFADTPLPGVDHHVHPSHTSIEKTGSSTFNTIWHAASHFVSQAAGWATKHPAAVVNGLKMLGARMPYIGSLLALSSVGVSSTTAAIEAPSSVPLLGWY